MGKRLVALALGCMLVVSAALTSVGCATSDYIPEENTSTLASGVTLEDGVLKVGVNTTDNAPFAGLMSSSGESSSRVVGLDVDIAAALADELGLELEIVDVGSEIDSALEAGEVDIVLGVRSSDTQVECWVSDAYISSAVALFSASSDAAVPSSDDAVTIAAQASTISALEVTNQFAASTLVSTNDLSSVFDELTAGTASYAAADLIKGLYAARADGNTVYVVALMQSTSGYCIGVADENTDLKTAISDALATLSSNGMISLIEQKWLGVALDYSSMSYTDAVSARTDASEETTTE